jgi:hypothetical protein
MSIRSALFTVGILVGGAVLIIIGGFGAIMLLTATQCGGSSYLCNPRQTPPIPQPNAH